MKEEFKDVPNQGTKEILGETSKEGLQTKAVDSIKNVEVPTEFTYLQKLDLGLKAKEVENAEKAKAVANRAKSTYQSGKNTVNQNRVVVEERSENLSKDSTISTDEADSNAAAIANHFIPGVNHLVEVKFSAEGKDLVNYKSFELTQSTSRHHEFILSLSHDSLGVEETYQMEEARKLLGKSLLVTFRFKNISDKPERYFSGVITDISFELEHGSRGYIILKGYSPTILLDMTPHIQSFGGDSPDPMSSIVHSILESGYTQNGKYKSSIKPSNKVNLSYSCQYNETAYNFLARMAEAYGEQFYYDGEILHFGEISRGEKAIELVYGRDVSNVQVTTHARHINRYYYGYNSLNNEKLSAAGESKLGMKGTLAKDAYARSEQVLVAPSLQQAPIKASTNQDILQSQRGMIGSEGISVFVTSGMTTIPFLYPGCIVELSMLSPGIKKNSHFTTVMITDIRHSVDALGKYVGHFKAVDADTGYMPPVVHTPPTVEYQLATVVSNEDPQGKGRIQVRFDWQHGGQSTEWIRVMTNDAGSSSKVKLNRGIVFIPEAGDQVLVCYIGNNPDRPVVLGSLFHGENGEGGNVNNKIKSIITRSGCSIIIDDEENKGSITIKDPSGNTWYMDGDGNIEVTAPKNFTVNAGENINLVAGNDYILEVGANMTTNVGKDSKLEVVGEHAFEANKLIEKVTTDQEVTIGGDLKEEMSSVEQIAKNGNILIKSSSIVRVLGAIDAKVNKG